MQVQYLELYKMRERHGNVWEHVGGQVELDEVGAFGYGWELGGLDVGTGQDEEFEGGRVFDELADLQLLLLSLVFSGLFGFHLVIGRERVNKDEELFFTSYKFNY